MHKSAEIGRYSDKSHALSGFSADNFCEGIINPMREGDNNV